MALQAKQTLLLLYLILVGQAAQSFSCMDGTTLRVYLILLLPPFLRAFGKQGCHKETEAELYCSVIYYLQVWGFAFLSGVDRDLDSMISKIFIL